MVVKRWVIPEIDAEARDRLAAEASCSGLLASLLLRRGVSSEVEARAFLEPSLLELSDPLDLPDMDRAVERIERGIRDREKITIFGDYDVDGVSSTCLLLDFFKLIDCPVEYRLPHRLNEGYGLRDETIREFAASEVQLLITVDNGSSSRGPIELARDLGIDVVVTDHHQPSQNLPEPVALVNPLLDETGRAYRDFAGVGVAFKLVWALSQRLSKAKKLSKIYRDFLMDSLALVCLGTIADVVPLSGENRILAMFGLRALQQSKRAGIQSLVRACLRGSNSRVEASHVGYRLGPRLNAAGRLGNASQAIELLRTEDLETARRILETLETENTRRREIGAEIYESAKRMVQDEVNLEEDRVIVLGHPDWHVGVIGIVASRLTEEFFRPTLLISLDGDRSRGSARSIPRVHINDALACCADHLRGFGGHAMAAGVEMSDEKLPELRRALNEAVDVPISEMVPEVIADCHVSLGDLKPGAVDELGALEPFGEGNPEPLLVARDVEIVGRPRRMGQDGQHLSFFVRGCGSAFRAVAFGKGEHLDRLGSRSTRVDLLFQPQWNDWGGRREIELNVREFNVRKPNDGHS